MVIYGSSGEDNRTGCFNHYDYDHFGELTYDLYHYILYRFCISISIFGIWGNGMVIWFLCFRMKRNYFSTYILNLAIANFGFLVNSIVLIILYILTALDLVDYGIGKRYMVSFNVLRFVLLCSRQFFLTVISVDTLVSVFFPICYQRCRPVALSSFVCALIWLLAFLPNIIWSIYTTVYSGMYHLIVNVFFCLSLMTISSLLLSIKACCKSKPQRQKKLVKSILVANFFFLLHSLPFMISCHLFTFDEEVIFFFSAMLCASVNPLIYYLVGRPKKECSNKSIEAVLEKLFKEGEI